MATSKKTKGPTGLDILANPDSLNDVQVYVVFGTEEFLRVASLNAIRHRVLGPHPPEMGMFNYDGKSATLRDVQDNLATHGMFASTNLVFVENADDFVSNNRAKLEDYVANPYSTGVLILEVSSWPSNTRLAKSVSQSGVAIDCRTPTERQLAPWCRAWAKKQFEKTLSATSAGLLVDLVPGGVGQLDQEITKLANFVGKRTEISESDIAAIVVSGKVELVWSIVESATCGEAAKSLQTMHSLLNAGEAPMMVLAALTAQLRRFAKAYRYVKAGQDVRSAIVSSGVKEYFVAKTQTQMRNLGKPRLEALYSWLLEADIGLKGNSQLTPQHVLERLIVRVAS